MITTFNKVCDIVLGIEKGYVNDPQDPGGETKYGISKRSYPNEDILNMTLERARMLYKRDFWDPLRGDDLPNMLALAAFDAAVNNGLPTSQRWLQTVLHVKVDLIIGNLTIAAAKAANETHTFVEFMAQRTNMMGNLPGWERYGMGWSRRLAMLPFQAIMLRVMK